MLRLIIDRRESEGSGMLIPMFPIS